ncbi:hypothetical protein EWM64_g10775 [Hericium alpestre]|uniref:Uncharacterized protein n=1 Tax=Hericium alpestre TaxID=135208 RepID=A0A4Y9ZGU2_9AGAM|nr:hypothetical protein EWM64_g10775 [Hericium alpestre]
MLPGILRVWIPLIVFPALSAIAFHFLLGNLAKSGGAAQVAKQCPTEGSGPNALSYTGVPSIDGTLCILVSFFEAALHPDNLPLNVEFATSMAALVPLPMIEASRQGRCIVLAFPVLIGIAYQLFGAGAAFPIYCLLFILAGHHRLASPQAKITRAHAEATLFALLIGFVVLTGLMYALEDAVVTAIWQAFPLWMSVLQTCHLLVRRPSRHPESGYRVTQLTYLLTFLLAAAGHVAVMYHLWGDVAAIKHYFTPVIEPSAGATPLSTATMQFLQWDGTFFFGATELATFWFAESLPQLVMILLWNVAATIAFGPGAAVAGVFMWREARLNGGGSRGRVRKDQ